MDILTNFRNTLNKEMSGMGVNAVPYKNAINNNIKELSETEHDYKPMKYLKKDSSIKDILDLVKNKKLSKNKIKTEIKKHLKEPEELDNFLQSILDSRVKKDESKEATGSGGGVGAYEAPLFGKKSETKEATTTASSGQYSTPKMWAKSLSKKDWGGRRKTQIPGGKFVQVKKKCKKFPYCNQGDIGALNLSENEDLQIAIENVSKKYGLSESKIMEIILKEAQTNKSR
jgi:hypothetical protein